MKERGGRFKLHYPSMLDILTLIGVFTLANKDAA